MRKSAAMVPNTHVLPGEPMRTGAILTEHWLNNLLERIEKLEREIAMLKSDKSGDFIVYGQKP